PVSSPLTETLRSGEVAVGADMTDLISATGQRYHIASNAAPIHARSGEITGAILVFRDVTDERNKREELRRAMISLENASGMARLAAFRYEIKTHRRSGSSILYSIWPNDENGNPIRFEDWVYPDDIPIFARVLEKMETSQKQGETATLSFRVGQKSSLRYIRALVSLDLSNPDEPAVTGIMQDVTELTQSMMKLKDTQALWDAAINSIPILFTIKDMDDGFRYLLCNKAFATIFNFSPDEIVGKTDHDLFHDNTTLDIADQLNTQSTGTDGIMEIEGELPDGNGNLRYIKTHMRVFEDARGHRLLLAAGSDVTDMHRIFQNRGVINKLLADIIGEDDFDLCIQRTLETVCKILGASRGCLLRHEQEGNKAHCVYEYVEPTHVNASIRMCDYSLTRIRGIMENTDNEDNRIFVSSDVGSLDWSTIPDDWRQFARLLDIRAFSFSNIVCECEVRGSLGFMFEGIEHTFTDNDISLLHTAAHMIEVVLTRKHAQALIMDALNRAQAADKAKSFFIASVSHEIRTPLNSVIGFAELLREGDVSKDQAKEYLDAISSSANALLMLINDVLDLSKLEANQMKIISAFTDFNALCHEVLLIFTFRAQENDNKLVSDVPEDLPELDVDNIRIRQILINLLGNAVKFTKDGAITLHVSFTPDPGPADTGTLRFAVSDTGIGISE
ncbi:MAG: PAS domain-containing protein, partial [Clostridia bacterium]|nr:PAS domain-containing protein [Clostridia bacterium]